MIWSLRALILIRQSLLVYKWQMIRHTKKDFIVFRFVVFQIRMRSPLSGLPICVVLPKASSNNFQTISTPSSYSTCPGLSIKWTGRHLVTDSGTKCAWVIHESKAVQIHVHHSNRRCLYVPRVPGSVKNPHNNNNNNSFLKVSSTCLRTATAQARLRLCKP